MRATVGLSLLLLSPAFAEPLSSIQELKTLDIEDLLQTRVISASRTPEDWTRAPMALEVLTSQDIRRSGATRLPDVLRLATGLHVARYADDSYAISARGFSSAAGNKLQVLMDGRSLYTPLFSGVFWEVQDTLLEDLDRIEIVRGPGATMWGANAVNGVINFLTKNARDTQGLLVMGGGGTEERGIAGLRYGGRAGEYTYYRTYVKYQNRDEQVFSRGGRADDGMQEGRWGFRTDSFLPGDNVLTVQGDAYYNRFGIQGREDAENTGGNVLARWTHTFSAESELQVQTYYDRGVRDVPLQFWEDRSTYDLDVQHTLAWGDRHQIVWGGNYRYSLDETGADGTFRFSPDERGLQLFSGFVQDQIALVHDHLSLMLGSKFEHNDYSGFEVQPSGRLAWTPTVRQTVWAGVSRAVRTPTRVDTDLRFLPNPSSGFVLLRGNPEFRSEEAVTYELGYRVQPQDRVFVDVAGYYSVYDHLRTLRQPAAGAPLLVTNDREGETYGGEIAIKYQVTDWWQVSLGYAYLQEHLQFKTQARDPTRGTTESNDPHHIATFRSAVDLPGNWEFDWITRYVSALPNPRIPSYLVFDLRLAWHPKPELECAVVAQNVLDDHHPEFAGGARQPEVQHGVYGKVTWQF